MTQSPASVTSRDQKPSRRALFLTGLFCFILGYLATQKALFDGNIRQQVAAQLRGLHLATCSEGIRLPGFDCASQSVIKSHPPTEGTPLRHQFARLPHLSAAVDKLQWNFGSEADAVRLLTVWKALELGRQRQTRENYRAVPAVTQLLQPAWEDYPDMVAAASCLYCGTSFDILSSLISGGTGDADKLKGLAAGHPRLLAHIAPTGIFSDAELDRIATLHAELSSGGDSKTAGFIGSILLEQENYDLLKVWVTKGLNGGRALGDTELDSLPRELVIAAWDQGVHLGYDRVELSEYLVSRGYRPALRWVTWLESTDYKYLHGWSYERNEGRYQSILGRFTRFPASKGAPLAKFYSDNWATIAWDEQSHHWIYR